MKRLFWENLDVSRELLYVGSLIPAPVDDVVLVKEGGHYYVDIVFQGNGEGTIQPLFHIDMFLTLAERNIQTSNTRLDIELHKASDGSLQNTF